MPATTTACHFCKSSAESRTKDGKFAVCRKCAQEILAPLFQEALGSREAVQQVLDNLARKKAKPGGTGEDKLDKLIAAQRPIQFSRGLGRPAAPARGRKPTQAEVILALARAAARENREVLPQDIARACAKAGLKTATTAAELSIAAAPAVTAPARKPVTEAKPGTAKKPVVLSTGVHFDKDSGKVVQHTARREAPAGKLTEQQRREIVERLRKAGMSA
jgi:hypothetical protein